MIWEHRGIVAVIVAGATLVGVAAGFKLAQLERAEKYGSINVTIQTPDSSGLSQNNPVQISKNFYKPTAPTVPKNPVVAAPAKPTAPAAPTDGVSAESYIVGNLDTGDVYLERNADA